MEVEEETKGPKVPEEKKGGEEEVNLKHDALIEAKQDEFDEVEIIKGVIYIIYIYIYIYIGRGTGGTRQGLSAIIEAFQPCIIESKR